MQLDDLYQEVILDHYRHPRHFAALRDDETLVDEENPLCGDHIRMAAKLAGERLTDLRVQCTGCAICTASASMMAEAVSDQPVSAVRSKIETFLAILRGEQPPQADDLGDLVALRGVAEFPMRVKCATMPWHALSAVLQRLSVAK
ncbi:MAG: SUF system NifU family Fe-S cluster assembly protein [Verrucomicrobia bacterium]|nr:MAG: SUF system NifU family Fe-S cluster assembly protein [Verrucomicrobiota bacterium]